MGESKMYPRIIPPPSIVNSPKHTKGRRPSVKRNDGMSSYSSMISQTMTSSTDMSSQSSPRSQDSKRSLVLPAAPEESVEVVRDRNRSSRDRSHSSRDRSTHVSLHSSQASVASSQGRDSYLSPPGRRPSMDEAELAQLEASQGFLDVKDHNGDGSSSSIERSPTDKLAPLVKRKDIADRLFRKRGKQQQQYQGGSLGASSHSASYGSMTLGGDTSLSSSDTFQNSSSTINYNHSPAKTEKSKPNLAAKPQKTILKPNPNPNPIKWKRRKYYSSDEDSEPTSSNEEPSSDSDDEESWREPLQEDGSSKKIIKRASSIFDSVESGQVSIDTFSDNEEGGREDESKGQKAGGEGSDRTDSSRSLPSFPPVYKPGDSRRVQPVRKKSQSSSSSSSILSSVIDTSWNEGKPHSTLTVDEDETKTSNQREKYTSATKKSYSSWTSSDDWSKPREADGHWASARVNDLEGWTSGDDSTISAEIEETKKVSSKKVKKPNKPRSAFDKNAPWYCGDEGDDFRETVDAASISSDTSSVLSNLKKKKSPRPNSSMNKKMKTSDGSLTFGDLVRPINMSLSDDEDTNEPAEASISLGDICEKSPITAKAEESMSLGKLFGGKASPKKEKRQSPVRVSRMLGKLAESEESLSCRDLLGEKASPRKQKQKSPIKVRFNRKLARAQSSDLDSVSISLDDSDEDDLDSVSISLEEQTEDGAEARDKTSARNTLITVDEEENKAEDRRAGQTVVESRWLRQVLAVGMALFLIFDIVLVVILLTRDKDGGSSSSTTLATVQETICWAWLPGQTLSGLCTEAEIASGGGVANVIAEAVKIATPSSPAFSLLPASVSQADIPRGDFTEETARMVLNLPIEQRSLRNRQLNQDDLVLVTANGLQIVQVLESSVDLAINGQPSLYPYASGLRFSVDGTRTTGRIVAPIVNTVGVWGPLEASTAYELVTTRDWAVGFFQNEGTAAGISLLDALIEYATDADTIATPISSTREFVSGSSSDGTPEIPSVGNGAVVDSIALVESDICVEWVPGQGLSNICSQEETASTGGAACGIVAWSLLDELQNYGLDVDLFLLHAAECQTDILQGPFTAQNAKELLPFDNEIVLLSLTGKQIVQALEEAVDFALRAPANRGSYPYAGGLRFKVDSQASFGDRVGSVEWLTRGRWKGINEAATYPIATSSPLAEGELGYPALFDALRRSDPGYSMQQVFIDNIKTRGVITELPVDDYSTQRFK